MAVERGQVQEVGATQNGKPFLKIGGKKYFAGRCDVSSVKAGQMIEFEWNEFGDAHPKFGRSRGLQAWALVSNGTNGHAPPSALDDADRPFISNIVAHAIAAGLVKDPTELENWAVAAQGAMRALKGAKPPSASPRRNGALEGPPDYGEPPYDDGPPPEEPPRGTRTW